MNQTLIAHAESLQIAINISGILYYCKSIEDIKSLGSREYTYIDSTEGP
jgi:hypothetical protein